MAIDKINFYYPKGSLQSVYEGEALTALELAAKTSKKVDECVEIVNGVEQTAIEATAIVDDMYVIQNQFVTDNSDTRAQLVNDNQEYLDELSEQKTIFDNQMTTALNAFIDDTTLSKTNYETSLETAKTEFNNTMVNAVENIVNTSNNIITDEVSTKLIEMVNSGALSDIVDQQIFTDINKKLLDTPLSIKYMGAKGDGITDDTTSIQNALLSTATTIFFPKGNYKTTSSLNVPSNKIILFDKEAKIINTTLNNIIVHTDDSINANIIIKGGIIEGANVANNQHGIFIENCDNVVIDNMETFNIGRSGIQLKNCDYFKLINNKVYNTGHVAKVEDKKALFAYDCNYGVISNNVVLNNYGVGIALLGGADIIIENNISHYNGGMGIIGAGAIYQRLIVNNNNCQYNGHSQEPSLEKGGINFHGCSNSIITNNIASNNTTGIGISINGYDTVVETRSDYVIISNNICENNVGALGGGIIVHHGKHVNIHNNIVRNNFENIRISGTTDSFITNNISYDHTRGFGNIWVTIESDNIYIAHNNIGYTVVNNFAGIYVDVDSTNIMIEKNMFNTSNEFKIITYDINAIKFLDAKKVITNEINLADTNMFSQVLAMSKGGSVTSAKVYYTNATDANTGVALRIGQKGVASKFYNGTTKISQASHTIDNLLLSYINRFDENSILSVECDCNKVGTGKIVVALEYLDYKVRW